MRVAAENGATHVRFALAADLRGLEVAVAPAVRPSMAGEVANLANLKRTPEERRA